MKNTDQLNNTIVPAPYRRNCRHFLINRREVNKFFILFTCLSLLLFSHSLVFGDWEKLAKFEGNITAVHVSDDFYYATTAGSGVYRSDDGVNWTAINSGLQELHIFDITSNPEDPAEMFCISDFFIYRSTNYGASWSLYYTQIVDSPSIDYYPQLTCIDMMHCSSLSTAQDVLYVGTKGDHLWRYPVISAQWRQDTVIHPTILAIDHFDNHVYAGIEYETGYISGLWDGDCKNENLSFESSFPQTSCHSLAIHAHPASSSQPLVLAGTEGQGILDNSASVGSFDNLCSISGTSIPDSGTFHALDYYYDLSSNFYGFAGTGTRLWCLLDDPVSCVSTDPGYTETAYYGNFSAIELKHESAGVVGTTGKGLFYGVAESCLLVENSYGQIEHKQINRIVQSSAFGTDQTMFVASRSEGIYKSMDSGTSFTRFFCDPGGYGPVDILSLGIYPLYSEWYPVLGYGTFYDRKTLLAGSNGQGIFKTQNGGVTWESSNGGTLPERSVITDVSFSPAAETDNTAFAAAYGSGIYKSTDVGETWSLLPCTASITNIHDIEISPEFSSDDQVWAATEFGIIRYDLGKCEGVWTNNEANRIKVRIDDPREYRCWSTPDNGIWRRAHNGSQSYQWQMADSSIGTTAKIIDIDVSPEIYYDSSYYVIIMAIAYDSSSGHLKVYQAKDYFEYPSAPATYWTEVIDSAHPPTSNWSFETVAFDKDFDPNGVLRFFLGHSSEGLFSANYDPAGEIPVGYWSPASGYYALPQNVTDTEVDPNDSDIVLYATRDMGMFISYDGGETACPWGRNLYYRHATNDYWYSTYYVSSIAITDNDSSFVFFDDDFSSGLDSNFWTAEIMNPGLCSTPQCSWLHTDDSAYSGCYEEYAFPFIVNEHVAANSECAGPSPMNTRLYATVNMYGAQSASLLYGHNFDRNNFEQGQIQVRSENTGNSWNTIYTFNYSEADNRSHNISSYVADLPSENHDASIGFSYRYANYDNWWQVDNVAITGSKGRNVVIGTKKTPGFSIDGHGLFYIHYNTRAEARDGSWNWAESTDSNGIQYSEVSQVIYYSPDEDMWASIDVGYYPSYRSEDLGQTWIPVSSGITDALFEDIDYGAAFKKGRGIVQAAWCCSKGSLSSTLQRATDPPGAYYFNGIEWSVQNGAGSYALPETVAYEAIIEDSDEIVLIGGRSVGQDDYNGIWRYDTSQSPIAWYQVNAGLESNDLGKKVSCFLEVEGGKLLVGISDNDYGGVYMSDSGGFAWQRVDNFAPGHRGVNRLFLNERVVAKATEYEYYASMVDDGSRREVSASGIEPAVDPVPEFLINNELKTLADKRYPADNTKWVTVYAYDTVSFHNKTAGAGDVTSWSWDFGDSGASTSQNPDHQFVVPGNYTITLTVLPGSGTISHKLRVLAAPTASFPFTEDFEPSKLSSFWRSYTTENGRVRFDDPSYPFEGTSSLLLDSSVSGGPNSIAAAILPVDLSGATDVQLDFWWREFSDESDMEDGVFISDDYGTTWSRIFSFNGGPEYYIHTYLDLEELTAAAGRSFNDHFQIKFQYYDNWPITSAGYAIDLIRLLQPPPPIPATAPEKSQGPVKAWKGHPDGRTINISYDASDCTPSTVNIIYGSLNTVSTYTTGNCSGGDNPSGCCDIRPINPTSGEPVNWTVGTETNNIWFILVTEESDGLSEVESSWGEDSDGKERNGDTVSGRCGCTRKEPTGDCY